MTQDLFYVSPFYHLVLPLDKLIVLDADIEFKSSPELLHAQFSRFVAGQVAGVAKEMSQLYRLLLIRHRSANTASIRSEIISTMSTDSINLTAAWESPDHCR